VTNLLYLSSQVSYAIAMPQTCDSFGLTSAMVRVNTNHITNKNVVREDTNNGFRNDIRTTLLLQKTNLKRHSK
ncbi:MAG: hypothetical protein KA526_02030, partial [Chitinophagales bacterium]|nr:hypothetical protein [Chitinophagales bacterium]